MATNFNMEPINPDAKSIIGLNITNTEVDNQVALVDGEKNIKETVYEKSSSFISSIENSIQNANYTDYIGDFSPAEIASKVYNQTKQNASTITENIENVTAEIFENKNSETSTSNTTGVSGFISKAGEYAGNVVDNVKEKFGGNNKKNKDSGSS